MRGDREELGDGDAIETSRYIWDRIVILEIKSEIRKFSMMAFRDARDGVERAWIGVEKEV